MFIKKRFDCFQGSEARGLRIQIVITVFEGYKRHVLFKLLQPLYRCLSLFIGNVVIVFCMDDQQRNSYGFRLVYRRYAFRFLSLKPDRLGPN